MALKALVLKTVCQNHKVFTNVVTRFSFRTTYGSYHGANNMAQSNQLRSISTTASNRKREIVETTTGKTTVIEAVYLESDRKGNVLYEEDASKDQPGQPCTLCRLNLDLQHTDVLILSQFVKPNGNLLTQRISGLCPKQQGLVKSLVIQAQKAGLMINLSPDNCNKDPHKRHQWRAFNRYFVPEKNGNKLKRYI